MTLDCTSGAELSQLLRMLDGVCDECGLSINAAKTEVMSVERHDLDPAEPIALRGGVVKQP